MVGVTETWLSDSNSDVMMSGYKFIHKDRVGRKGGGTGILLAMTLNTLLSKVIH